MSNIKKFILAILTALILVTTVAPIVSADSTGTPFPRISVR